MKRKEISIIGAGNSSDEILLILSSLKRNNNFKIKNIYDDNEKYFNKNLEGIPIKMGIDSARKEKNSFFIFAIGSYLNKNNREKIFKKVGVEIDKFPNIIDNSAKIERNVSLGFGNIIYPYSVICSDCKIENFTVLTHFSILAHNIKIGSFTTLGSRSSILNNANIGKEVFIGANVLVAENIKIKDYATIAMGTHVFKNIPRKKMAFGNPVKII